MPDYPTWWWILELKQIAISRKTLYVYLFRYIVHCTVLRRPSKQLENKIVQARQAQKNACGIQWSICLLSSTMSQVYKGLWFLKQKQCQILKSTTFHGLFFLNWYLLELLVEHYHFWAFLIKQNRPKCLKPLKIQCIPGFEVATIMKSGTNAYNKYYSFKRKLATFLRSRHKKNGQAHKGKSVLRRRGESVNLSDM